MIAYVNNVLELIINIAIISGIFILVFFYWKLNKIEKEIEKIITSSEKERELIKKQGETVGFVDGELKKEEQETQKHIFPFKRKRERILSKIPFLK